MLKSTPLERRKAAWLYAQFTVAKSTSLKKFMVGLTPIRLSDIMSEAVTKIAPTLGGLVEFYRSPARVSWTPRGRMCRIIRSLHSCGGRISAWR